jgi:uncharacterized HAD superfamily protein
MAKEKTYKVFLIDVDGTLCENIKNEEGLQRMAEAKPFQDSIDSVNRMHDEGHFICIFTSRTDEHRKVTEDWLKAYGVKYDQILLNKPRKVGKYTEYHWIDDAKVRATTFTGKFSHKFRKEKVEIEVFDE